MLPVLREYLATGLVPRFPTLIVCGFMVLAGILSLFSGMILEVMAAKDRRDFEYRLNKVNAEKRQKTEKRVGCDDAGIQRSVGGNLSSADDI